MMKSATEIVREFKHDLNGLGDLHVLIDKFKDRKVIMLGEASHGTHEYYTWRSRISKILMEEHGFDFIAVEGDWPPCYHLNRYIKTYEGSGPETLEVLRRFNRWPTWMWANWEVHELAEWLKDLNGELSAESRKGFYGLDVYSLWESLDAILEYLEREDPTALETAKAAMRCFEPHRDEDGQRYARSTRLVPEGCQKEVNKMLGEIRDKVPIYNHDREHVFSTEQNALIANNAEEYYRVMMQGGASTWNLRDRHMMETLDRLLQFHGEDSKAIVWAHNTHIGDAAYTDMADEGLFNIGEVAREEYGREQVGLIGFGSYKGSVVAGRAWGADMEKMLLPEARPGSWEEICHKVGKEFFLLSDDIRHHKVLQADIDHRAVGVVYHPARERYGNYVASIIPERYDAFVHLDETKAVNSIDPKADENNIPETYPFGF